MSRAVSILVSRKVSGARAHDFGVDMKGMMRSDARKRIEEQKRQARCRDVAGHRESEEEPCSSSIKGFERDRKQYLGT
jgi:hypothetical protein